MNLIKPILICLPLLPPLALAGTGAELYNEFTDSDGFYPDPEWQDYVNELGQKLVEHSSDKGKTYYFFLLDSPEINAFATPDAYIYVNRGLITFLSSEDQLAAVIGHEIAHVVARHAAKRRTTNLLGKSAGIAAMALTGRHEMMNVLDTATRTMIAGYGREMELEADQIGAGIMARAGYNPLAVIDAVHVLKDQELFSREVKNQPSNYHGLFASHPQSDKRLHDAVSYALSMLPDTVNEPVRDFWSMIDGFNYGREASTGLSDDNVFFDKTLRLVIEFPEDWDVGFNRQQVLATAPAGRDEAWISVVRMTPTEITKPSDFVRDVLNRPDIVSESELEVKDCCSVYMAELDIEGTDNKRAMLAIRQRGPDIFVIRGEAGPKGDPQQLSDSIAAVVRGIRGLRVEDIKTAAAQKIKVITAEPGDTYEKLAQQSTLRAHAVETLRLINGNHPHGEPRAGDYVKIIQ